MNRFLVKIVQGKIVPVQSSKVKPLERMLKHFEDSKKNFIITIEEPMKSLKPQQVKLYRAFIIQASETYGCTFNEMEVLLDGFRPQSVYENDHKKVQDWTSKELDNFINQAMSVLSQQGFNFK